MSDIRIGISGWRYKPWRGSFYPEQLTQKLELRYASRVLRTLEINGSFYSLQTPDRYRRWREDTPDDFVFCVKGPRFITHNKKLKNVEEPLANFFASGVMELEHKLGAILWQFPASFNMDAQRLDDFLALLPDDNRAAAELASHCREQQQADRPAPPRQTRRLRHALEVRNEHSLDAALVRRLRERGVALVVSDGAKQWPCVEDVTADFIYIRLHGDEERYKSGYSDAALEQWNKRIRSWRRGNQPRDARLLDKRRPPPSRSPDVYCFFDNDVKAYAPFDAHALARKLKAGPRQGLEPGKMPKDPEALQTQ